MAIEAFRTTDSIGRPRTIHVCDAGHWHPNHRRAAECNRKTRQTKS